MTFLAMIHHFNFIKFILLLVFISTSVRILVTNQICAQFFDDRLYSYGALV